MSDDIDDIGGSGYSLEELSAYLDRGRTPRIPAIDPINLTRARSRLASSPWARSRDRSEDIPDVLSLECVGK